MKAQVRLEMRIQDDPQEFPPLDSLDASAVQSHSSPAHYLCSSAPAREISMKVLLFFWRMRVH
jgi:hypothetical protein